MHKEIVIDLATKNIKTDYKIDVKNLSKLEGVLSKIEMANLHNRILNYLLNKSKQKA